MKKIALVALAAVAGLAAPALAQQPAPAGPPVGPDWSKIEVKTFDLGNRTYMLEGFGGNTTIAAGDDGVIMVDGQFAQMHDKLKAAIAAVTQQPVRFLVNTHYHRDHIGGNAPFSKDGAVVVAQENVRKRLAEGTTMAVPETKYTPAPEETLPAITHKDGMVNWYSNVFPGILGRTCDRPCEPACRRVRVEKEPVAICRLKRVAADYKDDIRERLPKPAAKKNGKRIALVGGGPASLTVARDLAPLGYHCVVFDQDPKAGGMTAARLTASLAASSEVGAPRYESLQPLYNLSDRKEFETEFEPICRQEKLGVINYYSLAAGFLSGKYRSAKEGAAHPGRGDRLIRYLDARGMRILKALDIVATRHNALPAQVAIAWLIAKPIITAPIASATSRKQLEEIMRTKDSRASASSGSSLFSIFSARSSSFSIAPASSDLKTRTRARDSNGAFSSNEGFSVVAPTRTMVPSSITGRKLSCWARLKRWISSTNRSVPRPVSRR